MIGGGGESKLEEPRNRLQRVFARHPRESEVKKEKELMGSGVLLGH